MENTGEKTWGKKRKRKYKLQNRDTEQKRQGLYNGVNREVTDIRNRCAEVGIKTGWGKHVNTNVNKNTWDKTLGSWVLFHVFLFTFT